VAKNTRVPSAVGSIPVVGDLVKQADAQAQWLQELVEQNARLVGQLPATIKTLNDSLERFNQTISRLDRVVSRIESASSQLIGPLEQMTPQLDRQVALLASTVDRIRTILNELPGAGIVRRIAGGRPAEAGGSAGAETDPA
jgi:ABC-type transporter Mla subunit MlaD